MGCPSCGFDNPPGMKFCGGCGDALSRGCPACGFDNPPGFRFCGECGAAIDDDPDATPRAPRDYTPRHLADKILQSKSALEGERKQVTVMFADVKGSMGIAESLDPEQWHRILERMFEILADGVHRFEGTVNQYTGDGIMALFGAPISHEDHGQRACYAALHLRGELRDYAREVKRQHGVDFAVRFGLNSGDVVVGKIGDDLRMDYTAQGHAVGLAQRMEALASGGSIYLGDATASLVDDYFELEDLGDFNVAGAEAPVRVHELIGVGAARTRFDVSRAQGLARFVGRGAEIQTLEAALEQARSGNGQVVGVVADAGTGKSRLCFEFTELCRARSVQVNEGHCVAHGKNLPFLPVLEVIRSYYGIREEDDERAAREKIAGRMLLIDESYRDVLPLIFDFAGVSDPDRPPPPLPPEARQRQLFGVVRSLTQSGGATDEVAVILIEDLHWIDGGSEAWVAEWVDATVGSKTLLLVNFRPEYHASWMQRSHYQQLPLAPLSADAIRELLSDLIGSDPSTEGLAERIHAHTAGNPFFAEEVVQSLIESGQLEGIRGAFRLAEPVESLQVPPSVQAVLGARIDRLAEREKRVLQMAAVIGKDFDEPLLAAVAELPETELGQALAALRDGEFVHETSLFPVAEYSFKHPLTQAVALDSLLREKLRALHASVARALEARADDLDAESALLAHHRDGAGEPVTAARWHLRAAEWIGSDDAVESGHHARVVIDALRDRADSPEACRLLAEAAARLMGLGWRIGLMDQAPDLYADGCRWSEAAGDLEVEARLTGSYAAVLALAGRLPECLEVMTRFEHIAATLGDPELRVIAPAWRSYPLSRMGQIREVEERVAVAIAAARTNPDIGVRFIGGSLMGLMYTWLIDVRSRTHAFPDVQSLLEEALRWVRGRSETESECFILNDYAGHGCMYSGNVARHLALARQALTLADELANPIAKCAAWRCLSACLIANGEPEAAIELIDQRDELSRERQVDLENDSFVLSLQADARLALGDVPGALEAALEAVERVGHSRLYLPDALHSLTRALAGSDRLDEAEAALDRMEASAREMGFVNLLPLVAWRRAELAERRGDDETREQQLRLALRGFTDNGATGHAVTVSALLGDA